MEGQCSLCQSVRNQESTCKRSSKSTHFNKRLRKFCCSVDGQFFRTNQTVRHSVPVHDDDVSCLEPFQAKEERYEKNGDRFAGHLQDQPDHKAKDKALNDAFSED